MNQVTGNIFDMLLGFDPIAASGSQPTIGALGQGGESFDAILLSLLGNGTVIKATGDLSNSPLLGQQANYGIELPADGAISNDKVIETMLQQHVLGGGNNQGVDSIAAEITTDDTPQILSGLSIDAESANPAPEQDDIDLSADVKQFLNLPTRHVAAPNPQRQPQISAIGEDLPLEDGGIYKIASARVEGDAVRIELKTSSDPNEGRVAITLPKGQLMGVLSESTTVSDKRIPISGMATPSDSQQSIDGLLQKLNLVELKIVDPQVASTNAAKAVEVASSINSANGTPDKVAVPMLTLTIDRRLILTDQQAKSGGRPALAEKAGSIGVSDPDESPLLNQTRSNNRVISGRDVPTLAERMQFAAKDGLDRLLAKGSNPEQTKNTLEQRDLANFDFTSGRRLTLDSSMPNLERPAHVRFTLPDNLHSALRPNGEAIMLKIQPDHLGPARLLLEMKNGMLHARVTVETVAAREAVEGSLDRLVEQLQKQDIKVDQIQVTLQNESGRHQFFDRRSQYPHTKNTSNGRNNDDEEVLAAAAGITAAQTSPTYMSAQGLNLYA